MARAAFPRNAALPVRWLRPPMQCGHGTHRGARPDPARALRPSRQPWVARADHGPTSRTQAGPTPAGARGRPETTRAPLRGPPRACARSPRPRAPQPPRRLRPHGAVPAQPTCPAPLRAPLHPAPSSHHPSPADFLLEECGAASQPPSNAEIWEYRRKFNQVSAAKPFLKCR